MPFNAEPPCLRKAIYDAHEDACTLISESIHQASGRNFEELSALPPLRFIFRAYCRVVTAGVSEVLTARSHAQAERRALKDGHHAAEVIGTHGQSLGYTSYCDRAL